MYGVYIKFNIKLKKSCLIFLNCFGYVNGFDNFI